MPVQLAPHRSMCQKPQAFTYNRDRFHFNAKQRQHRIHQNQPPGDPSLFGAGDVVPIFGKIQVGDRNEKMRRCYPLVMTNIDMENDPFIDGLPIKNCDFPWLC